MQQAHSMKMIAQVHSDFPTKFGIPRQSGLVEALKASIIFEPEFRNPDAVRGLEGFSHIWLLWEFSAAVRDDWTPTVRPPRLGGNARMGVFASRSPFRPNPIGLSVVRLDSIEQNTELGPVLHISGADLMDTTPIFDIKPYLPYSDCIPSAKGGYTENAKDFLLRVDFPPALLDKIPNERHAALFGVLEHDPRPAYQRQPDRVYGLSFADWDIRFTVESDCLHVCEVVIRNGARDGL